MLGSLGQILYFYLCHCLRGEYSTMRLCQETAEKYNSCLITDILDGSL